MDQQHDRITVVDDVVCTVCGCTCDDLRVHLRGSTITHVDNACPLAVPWFEQLNAIEGVPDARLDGQPVDRASALEVATQWLAQSRSPLIFGLSRSSTGGQRAAVELADRLRGSIDTTASVCHGPSIVAIQHVGESTCSLGEVRHRSDLVVFWGADPVESHPRHLERYSGQAVGRWVPDGRAGRHLIVVDKQPTATSAIADEFVQIPAGTDFEVLWALRALVRGETLPESWDIGVPHARLAALASRFKSSRYGAIFFGLGLAQQGVGHANVEALLSLVEDLNAHTRFVARRLRIPGDVTGADCVLCWRAGYPFAVNFAHGYPRYGPGEFSANELLERQEVDLCVLVGSECVPRFSPQAQRYLATIPTIALEYPHVPLGFSARLQFMTAIYGVHARGTVYRMDEVPLELRPFLSTERWTDEQVLQAILARLPEERDDP